MCQFSAFIPWNNTENQTDSFLLHSNKTGNNCFSSQINSPTCVHIPSWLSLQKFDPLVIEHFQKLINISQPLKPLLLPLQHPCLVSTMSFLPFSVQPLERDFCIPKFFFCLVSTTVEFLLNDSNHDLCAAKSQ